MKKYLLATTFIAMLPFTAQAADLAARPYTKAPMPVAAPTINWGGFYVGANAGVGGDKVDYPFNVFGGAATGNLGMQSFGGFAGVQVGYNYMFAPSWLVGIEADAQWTNMKANLGANVNIGGGGPALALDAGTKMNYFGSVRGRLGYTITPQLLLYATGGWAYGAEDTYLNVNPGLLNFTRNTSLSGWTAGGGLEYMFAPGWSLKTEYLYYDFGKNNVFTAPGTPSLFVIDNHITLHTMKAGVNLHF